jgi:plasmid stabilization system protein ParE
MCSNDSPSVKPDGTTDAAALAAEYEEFLLDIEEQPLPGYRTEEMRVRIEEVRATLAAEGVAAAGQLQQLLRTVTEALADVQAARVVPVPESRDLSAAVPGANDTGAAYEITETEQAKTTNVLTNLLFTVVETPTHADRRRREEPAAREGDSEASDSETDDADAGESHALGVEGYAGPE